MDSIIKTALTLIAATALLVSCGGKGSRYDAEGSFESEEITVSAEATGKILEFGVREGQKVVCGEKLGCIDSLQLELAKLQLEKNIKAVRSSRPDVASQIAAQEAQLQTLRKEKTRIGKLFEDGAATGRQMDEVNSQISVLEAQIAAQKSTLGNSAVGVDAQSSSIELQIAQMEERISKCHIISPINGAVLTKYANAGEFASTGKPLLKIADLDDVFLRVYVTSAQLSGMRLGQKVRTFADFGGENVREYEGTVEWISSKSEFTPKNIQTADERENLVYAVKVAVKNDGFIKLGMYGGICL
ncbi:MAG: efflux RND transporter periplasmic adaptor subunit [Bacteroidia bacterium]|nr:efflux RND transporter periplasmic adaptor subunit [Bacteroidia bacterium]